MDGCRQVDGRAWSCIDFISDLHLCEQQPQTFEAWRTYLKTTPAQALFILGDLFQLPQRQLLAQTALNSGNHRTTRLGKQRNCISPARDCAFTCAKAV